MGMIAKRWLTALILGIFLLSSVIFLNSFWFEMLVSFLAGATFWEWLKLTRYGTSRLGCISGAILLASLTLLSVNQPVLGLAILGSAIFWWLCVFIVMIATRDRLDSNLLPTSVLPGFLIVLAGGVAISWLQEQGPADGVRLIEFFGLVWAVDCGSFFAGRRWGRNKLAPALSPRKTIQGAFGGAVSLIVVSGCIYLLDASLSETTLFTWLAVSVAVFLMCVVGDLYESAAKRNAGVKDSGKLLPGHGGILDRVDSVIAASPIYYVVLFW